MIKKIFVLLLGITYLNLANGQISNNRNIEIFCKVWGFLKYYHPEIAKGHIDWDKEFLQRVQQIDKIETKDDLSNYFIKWIETLGKKKFNSANNKKDEKRKQNYFYRNNCFEWMNDTSQLSPKLVSLLNLIKENKSGSVNYYVRKDKFTSLPDFSQEKSYIDSIYPSVPLRLLTLARYWNIINYFYPYKYKTDDRWDSVLNEIIPIFIAARDTVDYQLGILKMRAKLCDAHAGVDNGKYVQKFFGHKMVPFKCQIIDGVAIITQIYNDSLASKDDLRIGDGIIKVDKKSISEIIGKYSEYFSFSNTASKLRTMSNYIFAGNRDSVHVNVIRNGKRINKHISLYLPSTVYKNSIPIKNGNEIYKIIDNDIGYINTGLLKKKDVEMAMKKLWHTRALIFDVRNYPHGTILKLVNYLYSKPYTGFTSIYPEFKYPGMFSIHNNTEIGKFNKNVYKGKIIILVNEQTQSHAESTAILLNSVEGSIIIGSQTAGADGQVISFILPGNIKASMTGEGIIEPDVQRNGVMPDITVFPTMKGIRDHKDEVLEKALEVANSQ